MATTSFFAPAYFSPFYFAPLANSQAQPAASFFAPTYFTPFYFAPLAKPQAQPPVPPTASPPAIPGPYRDRDAYRAILALLDGTGAFASVLLATPIEGQAISAASAPLVSLLPDGWEEFDEVDPTAILRRVSFTLALLVRDDDALSRYDQINTLEFIARNTIEGAPLGGCLPSLTRLRRGRYDQRSLHPGQSALLDGEFTYMIEYQASPASP